MFGAIDHQRDAGSGSSCPGYSCNIVLVPGGVADEQVIEALRGEIGRFLGSVAHDPMEDGIGCEDAPQHGNAAQRFGCETNLPAPGASCYLAHILIQKIKVEIGETQGPTIED